MKALWKIAPIVAAAGVFAAGPTALPAVAMPAPAYVQGPWDGPPPEFHEVERRGFHDGIEGARKDYDNHRRPDVNNRDEFRHPHVPDRDREAYRRGFARGYQVGVEHLYGPGPGGPPPPRPY